MATHSNVLAWRIPGMTEPGGLPSMGSQRVATEATWQQQQRQQQAALFSSPLWIDVLSCLKDGFSCYILNKIEL